MISIFLKYMYVTYQIATFRNKVHLYKEMGRLKISTVYKYYIPERVIVSNVTLRNMIINRGEAEVDNHIPKGDISDYHPLR